MMRFLSISFNLLAAAGIVLVATRVLPPLWDTSTLDCIAVGAALGYFALKCMGDAFGWRLS